MDTDKAKHDQSARIQELDEDIRGDLHFAFESTGTQLDELEGDLNTATANIKDLAGNSSPEVQKQVAEIDEILNRQRQRLTAIRKSLMDAQDKRRRMGEEAAQHSEEAHASEGDDKAASAAEKLHPEPQQPEADEIRHSEDSFRDIFRALLMLPKKNVR